MPEDDLKRFENYLLSAGIKPRYVRRALLELSDHMADIEADAIASGMTTGEARREAHCRIGRLQAIADEIVGCQDLKTWPYRYPRLARVWFPVAYVTLLPAVPLLATIERAPVIARWLASAMLGAVITAAMFLMLQLSILFA